ncbi:hypothetical protein L0156_20540 [bacterium]|nr:hypothetical protein [bacterium]
MIFAKWIRDFVQFVPFLMLCGTLCAAPAFQVTETALSFGDLTFGQSRTLSFKVINLQATQLTVTMRQVTALFSISFGSGSQLCQPCQLTLGPNEIKVVDVTFPGTPRCVQVNTPLTVTEGSDQASVSLSAKLLCPELQFVGTGLSLSVQGNDIKASFSVINTGTVPSNLCAGQVLRNGTVVQNFEIPVLSTSVPTNQRSFQQLIPSSAGQNNIEVRLDTSNQNQEAQEDSNNRDTATITIASVPAPPPPPPPQPVTIKVSKTGSGSGTVTGEGINCGSDCASSVDAGTGFELRALPASNSTFRKWSAGTGSAAICNDSTVLRCAFRATQNSSITAIFELTQ